MFSPQVTISGTRKKQLRPANYPEDVPGQGSVVIDTHRGDRIAVLNISGRVFMNQTDNPFRISKREILKLKKHTNIIIVDFHAEATSEKSAFGWFLDGEVSAVIGTHTHVQTADETILPKGTAFITDVGMTGPINSVIGIKKDIILRKFLTYMPARFETAKGKSLLSAVVIDIDTKSGNARNIERLQLKFS
jgi:metallophosphoesterase (TIGR00282 family)